VRERGKVFTCETGRDCAFVVFAEMSGRKMKAGEVKQLLAEGQSAILDGFTPRGGGDAYAARLRWSGARVEVERADARSDEGAAGSCVLCGAEVRFARNSWRCVSDGCDLKIRGEIAGRLMDRAEIGVLLKEGRTARLYGFRHSRGTYFKAALVLDGQGGVSFDYKKSEGEAPAPIPQGGSAPAFGERVDCPFCVPSGERHPGYVIAGRSAWGCSRWKAGCSLRLPFEVEGAVITAADARALLGKKRKSGTVKTSDGRELGTVSFDPEAKPYWKLDAFR
jgi:DNA topoisomerase-3